MATFRAIKAATAAVTQLLNDTLPRTEFRDELDFMVIDGHDVASGPSNGASVLPYRVDVVPAGRHVSPAGRHHAAGPTLAVDVRLLVVVSHLDPGRKLALTGWVMRTLEEHPVLPAALLNRGCEERPVFGDEETVGLRVDALSDESLLALWELFGFARTHAVLLPYVLSGLALEAHAD